MKVTKMTKSIWIKSLALVASLFLAACGDESPFSKAEEDLDDIRYEANRGYDNQETEANSSYRSSSNDRHSSSSTKTEYESGYDYLTSSMMMNFTLTYYRQIACSMEGKGSKTCNYDDGDPRISFVITFYQTNGDSTTYSTRDKLGKNWFYYDNIGEWDGAKFFTVKVPAFTETVRICPNVEDDDEFGFHDKMNSGYCYFTYYIGSLDSREINYQTDYMNDYCELKWEWYLY